MNPQSATTYSRIAVEQRAPVARITLTHERQNVINFEMMDELKLALHELERHHETSVIVLSGSGEHFSAGVDIPSHTRDKVGLMLCKFHGVIRLLAASHKVTIACVRGNCLGGGAELALVCAIAFTAADAVWGFPEIKLGCYPPVAAAALAAVVGQKRAAELLLTGRIFTGTQAEEMGLANEAVPGDELGTRVEEFVNELKTLSPTALSAAKRALYTWDAAHFEKALNHAEQVYREELIDSHDAEEGIRAWMEKRAPKWTGE
ncbi:MAG TPA: enoyl-CoA hydratase/isomerase family protein [Terriglobales bacterium]